LGRTLRKLFRNPFRGLARKATTSALFGPKLMGMAGLPLSVQVPLICIFLRCSTSRVEDAETKMRRQEKEERCNRRWIIVCVFFCFLFLKRRNLFSRSGVKEPFASCNYAAGANWKSSLNGRDGCCCSTTTTTRSPVH